MSNLDFSQCKTPEEIYNKLSNSRDIPNDVARANVFIQHMLQKELLNDQNKFQNAQLNKMEVLNKWTRGLVIATWALVGITLFTTFLSFQRKSDQCTAVDYRYKSTDGLD